MEEKPFERKKIARYFVHIAMSARTVSACVCQ